MFKLNGFCNNLLNCDDRFDKTFDQIYMVGKNCTSYFVITSVILLYFDNIGVQIPK